MTYSISVVQLCPDAHRDTANAIAEAAGYGPGNLSVQLIHTDGSTWWGCHAWWMAEALEAVTETDGIPGAVEALASVVTSVRDGGDPTQHWAEALEEHQLQLVPAIVWP